MKSREHQRSITLRFLAEPSEVNFGGKVHSGTVHGGHCDEVDRPGQVMLMQWAGVGNIV